MALNIWGLINEAAVKAGTAAARRVPANLMPEDHQERRRPEQDPIKSIQYYSCDCGIINISRQTRFSHFLKETSGALLRKTHGHDDKQSSESFLEHCCCILGHCRHHLCKYIRILLKHFGIKKCAFIVWNGSCIHQKSYYGSFI